VDVRQFYNQLEKLEGSPPLNGDDVKKGLGEDFSFEMINGYKTCTFTRQALFEDLEPPGNPTNSPDTFDFNNDE